MVAKKNMHTNFNNLITIVSVACIVSIVAMVLALTDRVPELNAVANNKAESVKGYTRPDKDPFKDDSKNVIPEGVSLEGEPSREPVKLSAKQIKDVRKRFEQAVVLLHAKQYGFAINALDHILTITTELPKVYVNMGFAYLGLKDYVSAESAFERALELRADQANAYYGMAIVLEEKKLLEPALGAMRTFVHLADSDDRYIVKARAAIWEWKALLGRIPGAVEAPDNMQSQIKQKMQPHNKQAEADTQNK